MFDIPWGDLLPFLAFGVVVADASVAIRGDLSGFHQDLNRAKAETGTLGDKLKNALSPKNIIAGAGLLGIGLGIRQLVGFAGEAGEEFRALQQTTKTVDAVFGESAKVIHAWGETAAEAAGLSKREVNTAAAVMGQTLLNMGFNVEEAANKVVLLQQRAADLALAFGKDPQDAILAITAAMRGERDTIEKFGVSIKQADVNSRVLALGLDTSTAAAKKNSEAIAILDIVLSQSASSADRFANSQDDVAVKMAQAGANAQNLQAQFGQMVTEIQNGAFIVGDSVSDFFAIAFDPRVQDMANQWGVSFNEIQTIIRDEMGASSRTLDEQLTYMEQRTNGGMAQVHNAVIQNMGGVRREIESGVTESAEIFGRLPGEMADAMLARQFELGDSIAELVAFMEQALSPAQQKFQAQGFLASQELADALNSGIPSVRLKAEEMRDEALQALEGLNGYWYGKNLALTLSQGILDYAYKAGTSAYALGGIIRKGVGIESEPEDHNSPLYGITKWGGNIVKTIADGIYGELGTGSAAAGALAGALVPSLGMGAMAYGGESVGASKTVNYNLSVNGVPYQVRDPFEMVDQLLELGAMSGDGRLG